MRMGTTARHLECELLRFRLCAACKAGSSPKAIVDMLGAGLCASQRHMAVAASALVTRRLPEVISSPTRLISVSRQSMSVSKQGSKATLQLVGLSNAFEGALARAASVMLFLQNGAPICQD